MILFIFLLLTYFSIPCTTITHEDRNSINVGKFNEKFYPRSCSYFISNELENDCKSDIIFAVDASSDALLPILFNIEINLIKNYLATDYLNYKKISLAWYNQNVDITQFNTFNSKDDFDNKLLSIQLNNGSSLSLLLDNLNNLQSDACNSISTYIFLSHFNGNEIKDSIDGVKKLKDKGSINFIVLGNIISPDDINDLNPSNTFYWDFSSQCEPSIVSFFNSTLSCKGTCSDVTTTTIQSFTTTILPTTSTMESSTTTILPTTTTMESSTTTILPTTSTVESSTTTIQSTLQSSTSTISPTKQSTTIETPTTPFIPSSKCQDNIIIALDGSSDVLMVEQFEYEKNLIKYNITQNYTNFMLLSLAGYSNIVSQFFPYNTITDRKTLINDVDLITQQSGLSLSTLMKKLDSIFLPSQSLQSTFIFISDTTPDEVMKSQNYSVSLKNKGTLNFIILGNAITEDDLKPLDISNVYNFYFIDSDIPSLVSWFNASMACNNYIEPTSTVSESTFTPQSSAISQSTLPPQTPTISESTLTPESSTISQSTLPPQTSTISESTSSPQSSTISESTSSPQSSTISESTLTNTPMISTESSSILTIPSSIATSTINTPTSEITTPYTESTFASTPNPCTYGYPEKICDDYIILAIDASLNLNTNTFNDQINVIKNNITTGWNDFSKVALAWYSGEKMSLTFNTITTRNEFDSDLSSIIQEPGLSLTGLFKELDTLTLPKKNKSLSTFIFTSPTTDDDINNSIEHAKNLKNKGTLNFIVMDDPGQRMNLSSLNPSHVFNWDFSVGSVGNLVKFFNDSMVCEVRCVTSTIVPFTGSTISNYESTTVPSTGGSTNIYESTTVPSTGGSTSNYESTTVPSTGGSTNNYESTTVPSTGGSTNNYESTTIYSTNANTNSPSSTLSTIHSSSIQSSSLPSTMSTSIESTSIVTTPLLPLKPNCNNSVFFIIDHRQGITNDEFSNQVSKIKLIATDWDISSNLASIDINSKREKKIFLGFPIQPKSDVTLLTDTIQWRCIVAYLEQNANDCQKYCNTTSYSFTLPTEGPDQTMDIFLNGFSQKIPINSPDFKNFTIVLFTKTGTQSEIDKIVSTKNTITSMSYNVNFVVVKLSSTDNFNYSSLTNSIFNFDDPNLQGDVTNGVCP